MANTTQYPWRTRIGWECRGFMFYVDVCESECLDVARALWLTGADYVTLYVRDDHHTGTWTFKPTVWRTQDAAGYSVR